MAEPVQSKLAISRASDLVGGIAHDAKEIAEGYLELARHDLLSELSRVRSAAVASAVTLATIAGFVMLLLVGLCLGLAAWLAIAPWISFVAVGGAGLLVGAVAGAIARSRVSEIEKPRAIEAVKEDVAWLAEQT